MRRRFAVYLLSTFGQEEAPQELLAEKSQATIALRSRPWFADVNLTIGREMWRDRDQAVGFAGIFKIGE
jgi:hypothetical protein